MGILSIGVKLMEMLLKMSWTLEQRQRWGDLEVWDSRPVRKHVSSYGNNFFRVIVQFDLSVDHWNVVLEVTLWRSDCWASGLNVESGG